MNIYMACPTLLHRAALKKETTGQK